MTFDDSLIASLNIELSPASSLILRKREGEGRPMSDYGMALRRKNAHNGRTADSADISCRTTDPSTPPHIPPNGRETSDHATLYTQHSSSSSLEVPVDVSTGENTAVAAAATAAAQCVDDRSVATVPETTSTRAHKNIVERRGSAVTRDSQEMSNEGIKTDLAPKRRKWRPLIGMSFPNMDDNSTEPREPLAPERNRKQQTNTRSSPQKQNSVPFHRKRHVASWDGRVNSGYQERPQHREKHWGRWNAAQLGAVEQSAPAPQIEDKPPVPKPQSPSEFPPLCSNSTAPRTTQNAWRKEIVEAIKHTCLLSTANSESPIYGNRRRSVVSSGKETHAGSSIASTDQYSVEASLETDDLSKILPSKPKGRYVARRDIDDQTPPHRRKGHADEAESLSGSSEKVTMPRKPTTEVPVPRNDTTAESLDDTTSSASWKGEKHEEATTMCCSENGHASCASTQLSDPATCAAAITDTCERPHTITKKTEVEQRHAVTREKPQEIPTRRRTSSRHSSDSFTKDYAESDMLPTTASCSELESDTANLVAVAHTKPSFETNPARQSTQTETQRPNGMNADNKGAKMYAIRLQNQIAAPPVERPWRTEHPKVVDNMQPYAQTMMKGRKQPAQPPPRKWKQETGPNCRPTDIPHFGCTSAPPPRRSLQTLDTQNSQDSQEDADILLQQYFDSVVKPKGDKLLRAKRAIDELKEIAKTHFLNETQQQFHLREFGRMVKNVEVDVFGSFHHGTMINSSDLDVAMEIELSPPPGFPTLSHLSFPSAWSAKSLPELRETVNKRDNWRVLECLTKVSVPILKVIFEDDLVVDITFKDARDKARNRDRVIKRMISDAHPIIADLCMIAKHWAKVHDLNSAWHGGLNSVSWLMLVLCFIRQFHADLLKSRKPVPSRKGEGRHKQTMANYSLAHMFVNFLAFVSALPNSGSAYVDQSLNLWIWRGNPNLYIEDAVFVARGRQPLNIASSLLPHVWTSIATLAGYSASRSRSGPATVHNLVPLLFVKN
eukprot:GEMP01001501.1.p1 GENE.GEMP01001501.1~~GEMP01001501.1.p1  ORF type:complete len:1007 (+),score=137.63 GEMP01001501.1:20-3040(+)